MTKHAINASPTEVRKFGFLFAGICALLTAYLVYKESAYWFLPLGGAAFFLGTGLAGYAILKPVYVGWMKFAFVLGWVNTRILLGIFYYLILSPIGLFLRLIGRDLIDQRPDKSATSYWRKRERVAFDPKRMEHQF